MIKIYAADTFAGHGNNGEWDEFRRHGGEWQSRRIKIHGLRTSATKWGPVDGTERLRGLPDRIAAEIEASI